MMKIRILRGTNQIGGSSVIISTKNAKVVIDFGTELNDNPQKLEVDGLTAIRVILMQFPFRIITVIM